MGNFLGCDHGGTVLVRVVMLAFHYLFRYLFTQGWSKYSLQDCSVINIEQTLGHEKRDEGQKLSSEYSWWREGSWNPWSRKKTRANEGAALCSPRRRWQTAGFAELVMKSRTDTGGCWAKLNVHSGQPELMELSFKWDSSSLSGKVETAPTCWHGLKGYTWRHLSSWNLSYHSTNCSHKNICPRPSIK